MLERICGPAGIVPPGDARHRIAHFESDDVEGLREVRPFEGRDDRGVRRVVAVRQIASTLEDSDVTAKISSRRERLVGQRAGLRSGEDRGGRTTILIRCIGRLSRRCQSLPARAESVRPMENGVHLLESHVEYPAPNEGFERLQLLGMGFALGRRDGLGSLDVSQQEIRILGASQKGALQEQQALLTPSLLRICD